MLLNSLRLHITALLLSVLVIACGGGKGSSAPPPADFSVLEGNGQVTITWTATPGVDYWLMYAQTASPIDLKSPPGVHSWLTNVTSPLVLGGLVNGASYSFAMDARIGGGPGGAQTASITKIPRTDWLAGSGLPNKAFKGVAYGIASDNSLNYAAVGGGGAVYKSTDGTDWKSASPSWVNVAGTALSGQPVDFNAALFSLGQYVAVGEGGATTNIFHSTDLATWTASVTSVTGGLNALASDGTIVVGVGEGGRVWWSNDGATWTEGIGSGTLVTSRLYGASYLAAGKWAAVGDAGVLLTSADGKTWVRSNATLPSGTKALRSIAAIGDIWVIAGDTGTLITSVNGGADWTANDSVGTDTFYAVNASVTTVGSLPQFLVVGASGAAFISANGLGWDSKTIGAGTLYGLWGSATRYVAVGAAGASAGSR